MNIAKLRSVEVRHKKFGAGKIEEVYPSEQPKPSGCRLHIKQHNLSSQRLSFKSI